MHNNFWKVSNHEKYNLIEKYLKLIASSSIFKKILNL